MFKLDITGSNITITNIEASQLGTVLTWYNQTLDYGFATGKHTPVALDDLQKKYASYSNNSRIFFAMIRRKKDEKPIGLLKGFLIQENKEALWLSILLILKEYQNMGYGGETICEFFNQLRKEKIAKTVYLSCAKHNAGGLKFWNKMGFKPMDKMLLNPLPETDLQDIIILGREI